MLRFKLLMAMALVCQIVSAQYEKPREIDFEISKPFDVVDATSKNYFRYENFVFSVKIQKKKVVVQKFDSKTMRQVFKRELPRPESNEVEGIYQFGNRFFYMYNLYNRSRESEQLFYREISFDKGTWKGPQKMIVATKGKVGGDISARGGFWGGYTKTGKFDIEFSADRSRMLVQYRHIPEVKNDAKSHDIIGFHVFDNNMREIWSEEVEMPYTEAKMDNMNYSVDDEGNAYILSKVYEGEDSRDKKSKDAPNYHVELLKKEPGASKLSHSKVDLGDKFIRTAWLYESPEDKMVCAGYYGNTQRARGVDGVFYMKVDKSGRLSDSHHYEIPVEVLNQYVSDRTRKKNNKKEDEDEAQFYNLLLRDLKFYEDGSILLIGEQHYVVESTSSAGGVRTTSYTYYYNDILATKIDASGELSWMIKLPKRQRGSAGRGSMSYKHYYKNGYHYFMYVDNVKNQNLPQNQAPAYHIDKTFGFLTSFIVDDRTGSTSQETILDMKDAKGMKLYQFAPSRTVQVGDDEFIFEAYKKSKEDVMVKIRLKA